MKVGIYEVTQTIFIGDKRLSKGQAILIDRVEGKKFHTPNLKGEGDHLISCVIGHLERVCDLITI